MRENMKVGDVVEFQIDVASWGTGRVVAYDEETEIVAVEDSDDGTMWRGPADKTEPVGE